MADLSDAANALVGAIAAILYPQGTSAPSLTGDRYLVYHGTPEAVTLATDLAAGTIHVSVFPEARERITSVSADGEGWEDITASGTTGTAARELRRQTRSFAISIRAAAHDRRDAAAAAIDAGLAAIARLPLADGSVAVMRYESSAQVDAEQTAGIYRRELVYALDYPTTQQMVLTAIATTITNVTPAVTGAGFATVTVTD
ncbi:MAG: hypothetical protein KGK11_07750 [Sphingomonadales bacterium]|nr:hypothetical protein [Sphingomonadales bacterium]